MTKSDLLVEKLSRDLNVKELLLKIGATKEGVSIMEKKSEVHFFYIKNIDNRAANILKQDVLSVGGEFALPSGAVGFDVKKLDGLLMLNKKQLISIAKKCKIQPFGLSELGDALSAFVETQEFEPKIMGIINVNNDSFYNKSRFRDKEAFAKIEQMIEDGADIIDIGAISTRPGSAQADESEELKRVKDIADFIYKNSLYKNVHFSIDSYRANVIDYCLSKGFVIANDITGLDDINVAKSVAAHNAKVVIMHKKGDIKTMQQNPEYKSVISEVSSFFEERIKFAKSFGIDKKDIIVDVGIGFGKSLEHNLELIKHTSHFKKFGCEILIAASRKSLIDKIYKSEVQDRLPGTLILHFEAFRNGANIIRCHDVREHKQALSVYLSMWE